MAAIIFDNWSGGLDLRRSASMSAANVLRVLKNAYVTTGKAIRKRPCLSLYATLEAGTVGLKAMSGKLSTFYGPGTTITHANTTFQARRVQSPSSPNLAVTKCHYGESFNGYLYCAVEYSDGTVKHHYLDDPGAWVALTNYALGDIRRPTTANGFRYEVTVDAGAAGALEPVWPTTIGGTIIDGGLTWTCRTFAVVDTNCPHSKSIAKIEQKLYASDVGDVDFCATGVPRDWTTASDAGSIPSEIHASGSSTVTSVGKFGSDLAIFFADSLQVWDVDPDPAFNAIRSIANNIGTRHGKTPAPMASDLVFLAKSGFRSIQVIALTDNMQENDVGSAIDQLRPEIADSDDPIAVYYPTLGQLWTINGANAYVYSFARSVKLSAWAQYTFPVTVTDAAVLDGELYLRAGDKVYRVDAGVYTDDGVAPLVEVEMFYQDNKAPGIEKMFTGFDGVVVGSPDVAFRYDPRNTALVTDWRAITGDMRPGDIFPMELCATSVAPILRHQADEAFQVDAIQTYFQSLGAV